MLDHNDDFESGRRAGLYEALDILHAEIDPFAELPSYARRPNPEAAVFAAAAGISEKIRLCLDKQPNGIFWEAWKCGVAIRNKIINA